MNKLVSINKDQDESVREVLEVAAKAGYDACIIIGYKRKAFEVLHSSGVNTLEEIGALEVAKRIILESSET